MKTRGETKLRQAAEAFDFDFDGKTVLDIGSSTGGFTAYALACGAKKVIAVEKGTRQMLPEIAQDLRVELHEKMDIFDVVNADLYIDGKSGCSISTPDVILADVSFVSLRKILKYVSEKIAGGKTEFLVMLKPQFEAKSSQLWNGVVKNEKMRREIIKDFERWLKQSGFLMLKKHDNELTGKNGNRERFYLLRLVKNR